MKQLTNIILSDQILSALGSNQEFSAFLRRTGCDGAEVIRCGEDTNHIVRAEQIVGVHLLFYADWVDFWNGDTQRLLNKFGSREAWEAYYGCTDRDALLDRFQEDLDFAQQVGAEYVVFHVSDVSVEECFDYRWQHTSQAVVTASLELMNALLKRKPYTFTVLMENLWWPGLTMQEPEINARLLDQLQYGKKGFLMDTGHLLHTCPDLRSQQEGIAYLHRILDRDPLLLKNIRAVHLHQTINGAYVKKSLENVQYPQGTFSQRFAASYAHIGKIDAHLPFSVPEVAKLIEKIQPEYLVHELHWKNWLQRECDIQTQMQALMQGDK